VHPAEHHVVVVEHHQQLDVDSHASAHHHADDEHYDDGAPAAHAPSASYDYDHAQLVADQHQGRRRRRPLMTTPTSVP